jgi:hypothetical protein
MFQTLSSALAHQDLFLFSSALVVCQLDSSVLTISVPGLSTGSYLN